MFYHRAKANQYIACDNTDRQSSTVSGQNFHAALTHIWGLWHQKWVSQAEISNYIPQFTVGCNYLSLSEISVCRTKVFIFALHSDNKSNCFWNFTNQRFSHALQKSHRPLWLFLNIDRWLNERSSHTLSCLPTRAQMSACHMWSQGQCRY